MDENVIFLGKLYKNTIVKEMNAADAYLFSSDYETFSAVCAQALCCGCPLIGPAIPSIQEYAGNEELIILESNDVLGWFKALELFENTKDRFTHEKIAQKAKAFLSHEKIKQQYKDIIA